VLTASGYVVAQQKASLASKATGRLVYLGVEEGDRVQNGQVVARIEDQDVQATLARTQADLRLAQADSSDASQSYQRQKTLLSSGLASQAEMDAAEARLLRVSASIGAARAVVKEASVALENTRIRAPFSGTVLTKDADVGEVVAPFASSASARGAVVTIANMSSLLVEADVSESNITRVRIDQPCEIVLDAYPDVRYPGYVHKIVPTADRAKATVLTKVRFRQLDARVLPEMSAKVTFLSRELPSDEADNAPKLTVPAAAVVTRNDHQAVFLISGNIVREIEVKTGELLADRIVVTEGVAQGDRVVLRPSTDLSDGSSVVVK
jgi:RND family efflux transporter MFP subunit